MFNIMVGAEQTDLWVKDQINFTRNISYYGENTTWNAIYQQDMLRAIEQALQNVYWINRITREN